jgi:hypothetical protein
MAIVLNILLGALLVALFVSRIHFHFHFSLEMSRESKSRWQNPTPRTTAGKYTETRREKAGAEIPGEVLRRPSKIQHVADPGVEVAIDQQRKQAEADIASALVNLGMEKLKARKVASEAMGQGKDFDSRVRWAINQGAAA